tara:strand:- start:189 stop:428 length:240 start_codon:yes stop_codon:yes gene_type:complete
MAFTDYLVAVPLQLMLGISTAGPVAGGVFSAVQRSLQGIAANSFMASVQSVAMGGAVSSSITLAVAGAAGVAINKLVLK